MDKPATPAPRADGPPSWFAQNGGSLLVTFIMIGLVVVYLNVWDVLKVLVGLGLVIFIHELGHFAAAKWCGVHVKTFSIGFGPSVPGCRFQYGETTYMLAMIPLGGYVNMVGEGDGSPEGEENDEPEEKNPRSFRNKTVGQRMLIISAGVIMNILLAAVCFVIAYLHGVEERSATIGRVESASAAWRDNLHSGMRIEEIGDKRNPVFADIQPIVMSSNAGEKVRLVVDDPATGETHKVLEIEPTLDGEGLFPLLGIGSQQQLTVMKLNRPGFRPTRPGSAASKASPGFEQGDRIVGMTDPADPTKVTPLKPDPFDAANGRKDFTDYTRRMHILRGKPVTFQVLRDGQPDDAAPTEVTVAPQPTQHFGMRMNMGEVAAVRKDSPATKAKLFGENPPEATAGIQPRKPGPAEDSASAGDKIKAVEVTEADGTKLRFVASLSDKKEPGVVEKLLDPVRLPFELESWAARQSKDRTVRLTVSRYVQKHPQDVRLELVYDDTWDGYRESVNTLTTPQPLGALGLAYYVEAVVADVEPGSPAEKAGIVSGDVIEQVRAKYVDEKGETQLGRWNPLKGNQWAFVFDDLQTADSPELDIRINRGVAEPVEVTVKAVPDESWPAAERGVILREDFRLHRADGIFEALSMGANRTVRTIKIIYQNLRAMVFGRVSAWTMSGPLTIGSVSYKIAGENMWQFILFIGMISVNLAVINFLPIPVLDGGHMVFLIYEKIVGKPPPDRVYTIAMLIGFAMILSLMAFVIFLDIRRLFF